MAEWCAVPVDGGGSFIKVVDVGDANDGNDDDDDDASNDDTLWPFNSAYTRPLGFAAGCLTTELGDGVVLLGGGFTI